MVSPALRFPTMQRLRPALVLVAVVYMFVTLLNLTHTTAPIQSLPGTLAQPVSLPLQFVPNAGQADPAASMIAEGPAGTLAFGHTTVGLTLPAAKGQAPTTLLLNFNGATTTAIQGGERLPGVINYHIGFAEGRWQRSLPAYSTIVYEALYPGIDLIYEGRDGALKGTYFVAPGADPMQINWHYQGANSVQHTNNGDLAITLPSSQQLSEAAPIAWQTVGGQRIPVEVRYTLLDNSASPAIGFALGAYDPAYELVIDPTLSYSTYVGGAGTDWGQAVAVDAQGNVIITGYTYSTQFPGRSGTQTETDIFVTKLNAAGTAVLYSTVIGGSDDEKGLAIAVDAQGNAWVTGHTESNDFPTVNPISNSYSGGNYDTFAAKLDPNGTVLAATYLGDDASDEGTGIAVDPQGNAYIAGSSYAQFGQVALVIKLSANGQSEVYKGYFGAAERGFDRGTSAADIAVDAAGNAYVTGKTNTVAFPVVNALKDNCGAPEDDDCPRDEAFVSIINPTGTELTYSTYLGGTESDKALGIALDPSGNIYLVGSTFSFDFPTANPIQATKAGPDNFADAFVTKLSPTGDAILFSTYLGGDDWEDGNAIAVDNAGNIVVAGLTSSNDFPLADPVQNEINGICIVGSSERYCYDAFVTKINANGQLAWSTYLGGTFDDSAYGVAIDTAGNAYVAGKAESFGFPTTPGSFQPEKAMQDDAFIVKFGPPAGGGGGEQPPPPAGNYRAFLPLVVR